MQRMDIEALRTLCTIADNGGITRAADILSLSQSAVSHKIKRLETNIGCNLLARRAGAPLLSDDGKRLLSYARRICSLHDEALQSLSKEPLSGQIRLGMTEDVTSSDLSRILGRFTRLQPDVTVRTNIKQSLVLQKDLDMGLVDIAVMQVFTHELQPKDITLFKDKLHWVCAPDLSVDFSRAVPFLSYDKDCFFKNWAMENSYTLDNGLETVLECASSAGIASAVRAGLGVALLPGRYLTDGMHIIEGHFPSAPELSYTLRIGKTSHLRHIQSLSNEIARGVASETTLQTI